MEKENYKIITIYYGILLLFTALGAAAGALYYVNRYSGSAEIINYMNGFVSGLKNGTDKTAVFLGSLKRWGIVAAVFAASVLVKPGALVGCTVVIREGFVYGFTNAAFIGTYHANGVLIALLRLPYLVPCLITMTALGAVFGAFALKKDLRQKNFIIFLIIFFLLCAAIFCAASALEAYVTTIFMRLVPISVT